MDEIKWQHASGGQWYAYIDNYQVGAAYIDSSGFVKAWAWPLVDASKTWFNRCISITRGKEEIEDYLRRKS